MDGILQKRQDNMFILHLIFATQWNVMTTEVKYETLFDCEAAVTRTNKQDFGSFYIYSFCLKGGAVK